MSRILVIPGSLRASSSSNLILKAIISFSRKDSDIEVCNAIGSLPHFNDPEKEPAQVMDFKKRIKQADAVLICTPEYAFGIPGALKNALDWTVGSGEFLDKPVGIVTASSQGEKAHSALRLVLTALSATIIEDASLLISSVRATLDSEGKIKEKELEIKLRNVVPSLMDAVPRKINIL